MSFNLIRTFAFFVGWTGGGAICFLCVDVVLVSLARPRGITEGIPARLPHPYYPRRRRKAAVFERARQRRQAG